MTQIIAVLNHKGGVGKSTTAVSLAAALQLSKKNVLAIDMDGQANLTEALGLSIEEEQTVYGAMCGQYTLPLVKLHNGITVSPSCLDLSAAELELISEPGRELILKGLITKAIAKEHFDYIIIDCPPSLGLLTLNALTAADYIIIPVQAQYLAMRGMAKLMDIIRIVQERLNSNLKVGGIVITQFDRRKTLNRSVREIVNDSFHEKVFKTVIRDNVALAEAPINGKTIFEYNPKSNGASDYMSLAKSFPGIMIINMSVFCGFAMNGVSGAVAAAFGLSAPALLAIAVVTYFYASLRDNIYVIKILNGVRSVVVPIIISACLRLKKTAIHSKVSWLLVFA